jgi:hypothetical protein
MGAGHSNGERRAVHAVEGGNSKPSLSWRIVSDEAFLAECDFEAFRASGPGGQKRNKTSSAVRLTHRPSGESAIASESRSQHDNRRSALRRVRHRVVMVHREAVDLASFVKPKWFEELMAAGRIAVSKRDERYLAVVGLILDVLAAGEWSVSVSAKALGITTSAMVSFLQSDQKLMTQVNHERVQRKLKALGAK